jgi:hypothetical protein
MPHSVRMSVPSRNKSHERRRRNAVVIELCCTGIPTQRMVPSDSRVASCRGDHDGNARERAANGRYVWNPGILRYPHQDRRRRRRVRQNLQLHPSGADIDPSLLGGVPRSVSPAREQDGSGSLAEDYFGGVRSASLSNLALLAFLSIEAGQQVKGYALDPEPARGVNGCYPAGGRDGVPSLHRARVTFLDPDRLCELAVKRFDDCGKGVHANIATLGSDTCQHGM